MKTTEEIKSKIKKGDNVKILAGKDRGKTGKIISVFRELNKVVVEGMNTVKKHQKARGAGKIGQIISISMPVHLSNVAIICPACSKPTRIAVKTSTGGKNKRICKKCGAGL